MSADHDAARRRESIEKAVDAVQNLGQRSKGELVALVASIELQRREAVARAEAAEANLSEVYRYAQVGATTTHAQGLFEVERRWLDLLHMLDSQSKVYK